MSWCCLTFVARIFYNYKSVKVLVKLSKGSNYGVECGNIYFMV